MGPTKKPVPFEIAQRDGARIASNGAMRIVLLADGGRLFRRRGMTVLPRGPVTDVLVPQLNALAGELLARADMPADEAIGRLNAIAGMVSGGEPVVHEWAVAELDGVRAYCSGTEVVVTRLELLP